MKTQKKKPKNLHKGEILLILQKKDGKGNISLSVISQNRVIIHKKEGFYLVVSGFYFIFAI